MIGTMIPGVGEAVAGRARADARDEAFTEYMAARQPVLLRRAYLLTGDHASAEDLVQTTLAKLYLAWDKVRDPQARDGYARRIMVNEFNSLWRRPWRRRERSTDELPETPSHDQHEDGTAPALWDFVQSLPPRQRAVIVLRYYEELSEAEIAEVLGCSPGTVKSQASRALANLRARAPMHLSPREEEL